MWYPQPVFFIEVDGMNIKIIVNNVNLKYKSKIRYDVYANMYNFAKGETSDEALIFILGWQEFGMKSKLSWHQSLY